jgi:hypothetical protein
MIQRIQSVWLLLAALVMASIFYFPTYSFSGTSAASLTIGNDFLAIILASISIILSLVAIFRFKNRKSQIGLTWLNILVCVALQAWLFVRINNETSKPEMANVSGHYWIGLFVPLITILLLFFARGGIRKDEKLVKSLDRLR